MRSDACEEPSIQLLGDRPTENRANTGASTIPSYELLRTAMDDCDVSAKQVAAQLGLSTALVYKWIEMPPTSEVPDASGAYNPMGRVRDLHACIGDIRIIQWICEQAG